MAKLITMLLVVGVVVGIVGGIANADRWFYFGELVVLVGVVVLYALAIWKNPYEIARRRRWRAEDDGNAQSFVYPQQISTDHIEATRSRQQPTELPSNGTPHADARSRLQSISGSRSRAGGRER